MSLKVLRHSCFAALALVLFSSFGCVQDAETESTGGVTPKDGSGSATATDTEGTASSESAGDGVNDAGEILIDGSSTVWPVSMAMAEAFMENNEGVVVNVAAPSGTSGGFKKFMVGETDINDASRPIKDSEVETCAGNGIETLELTVAIDGLSVVVSKENTWCDSLSFAQLKALWEPGSKVKTWKDLNPEWPDEEIKLFGPDGDSGTFEYFTEHVVEQKKQCRDDYEPATDDNVLVKGVAGDKNALGYFGYAYYLKARKELKGLAITGKEGGEPVLPTAKTIETYEYPLARPIFIYVNKGRLSDKGMADFLKFYVGEGQSLVPKTGYIQVAADVAEKNKAALEAALAE